MPVTSVGFQLASPSPGSGGKIPPTIEKLLASGYAEAQGALLLVNASDEFAACSADPAAIAAVALTPGGTDTSGFNILGTKEFPPGSMQGISIANGVKFISDYVGSLPAVPGGQYGVIRDSDGIWKVDFNETINVVLQYLGVVDFRPDLADASEGLVLSSFLPAIVQASN
jgi:hypothetical protein